MKYFSTPAILSFLVFALIALTNAIPTNSTSSTVNNGIPNGATSNLLTHPRGFGLEYIALDNDQYFQPCFPNHAQPKMCTVSFIEHPSWNSLVQLFIYDNTCKRIGENYHVPRDYLAAKWGWGMSSELPMYLVLEIERGWQPGQNNGVKLNYGNTHFKPFVKSPFAAEWTTNGRLGEYTVFRAAFPCK
ncbi:hypothetical protein BKA61DRAFT_657292 [Leptodontidium sp. MPI-SDFR-AT-0119]|nr:hypothetical protein BKA61DRAFT_657292 [Leptodontidium sp. MPI-SDFR-AT-0119]